MSSDTEMLAYFANINTMAGRAGRSIDPTKPGPDADRIAWLKGQIAFCERDLEWISDPFKRANVNSRLIDLRAELSRLRNEQPKGDEPYKAKQCDDGTWMVCTAGDVVCTFDSNGTDQQQRAEHTAELLNRAEATPSPAPSPEPQDVREALLAVDRHPGITIRCEDDEAAKVWNHLCTVVKSALAQSAAQPEYHPDGRRKGKSRLVYDKEKRTIVPEPSQSDAQPVGWRDAVSNALDAWFASPPNETDLGLERSMDAALKAARAVLATPTSPSAGLIETADEMWKALRPFAFHGECYFDAKDNETFSPTIARNRLTVGKLKAASKAYRAYEALAHAIAADRSAPRSDRGGA